MRVKDDQGRGDKIFRNSVPLVTRPFKFFPLFLLSNLPFHFFFTFQSYLRACPRGNVCAKYEPMGTLKLTEIQWRYRTPWARYYFLNIMVSWISIHQIIKYVSRCIHTPCSRRRATTFQKEEKRITSSEEEVTVMTRTMMAPVTSLSSQTTLFPPSLQGRIQEKRQLMKYNISLILFNIMSLFTKSSR